MNKQQEKEALKNDAIIGLRILLDHAKNHCDCEECKAIRKRLSMAEDCNLDTFQLPQTL